MLLIMWSSLPNLRYNPINIDHVEMHAYERIYVMIWKKTYLLHYWDNFAKNYEDWLTVENLQQVDM